MTPSCFQAVAKVESIHYEIDGNDARYNGKGGWKSGVTSCTHCDLKV